MIEDFPREETIVDVVHRHGKGPESGLGYGVAPDPPYPDRRANSIRGWELTTALRNSRCKLTRFAGSAGLRSASLAGILPGQASRI